MCMYVLPYYVRVSGDPIAGSERRELLEPPHNKNITSGQNRLFSLEEIVYTKSISLHLKGVQPAKNRM